MKIRRYVLLNVHVSVNRTVQTLHSLKSEFVFKNFMNALSDFVGIFTFWAYSLFLKQFRK